MRHLEILAQQIASRGVKHAFGIPGSGPSLFLIDALENQGVNYHLTHFEGTAAMMAGSIGRLSGQSGVAISIKGPGLSNMLPGLAVCSLDAFPIVSISEAYPPNTPPEKAHKRLDHYKLVSSVAKQTSFLSEKGPSFDTLSMLAEKEVPGVVHLDISASPVEDHASEMTLMSDHSDGDSVDEIVKLLKISKRPVVIAGTLAVRCRWNEALNLLPFPVFSTSAAKGVVNELLPHAAGVFTGVGGPLSPERKILPKADFVLGLGLRDNEVLAAKPFHCPSANVDPLGRQKSLGFGFDACIEGRPLEIEELFNTLTEREWGLDVVKNSLRNIREYMLTAPFLPARIFDCIERQFENKARLVLDTGDFCTIGEHAWRVIRPEWYLASGQGRYMGVGIPLGIGAAIYDPKVPTVVFVGDGGIGMFVAEVKLSVQNKLPILIVLLSDGYLGTIRGASLKNALTQYPTTIHQPSWIHIMEGFGVSSVRIETLDLFEKTLCDWDRRNPLYLEVAFNANAYQRMTEGIR